MYIIEIFRKVFRKTFLKICKSSFFILKVYDLRYSKRNKYYNEYTPISIDQFNFIRLKTTQIKYFFLEYEIMLSENESKNIMNTGFRMVGIWSGKVKK